GAAADATITLTCGDLPPLTTSTTISANGATLNGGGANRGLFAYSGTIAISNFTITNTLAQGGTGGIGGGGAGVGGGLFVAAGANVTITNVAIQSASAVGG